MSKFAALRGRGGNPNLKPSRISPVSNSVLILGNCKYHHNHMGPQINPNIYLILRFWYILIIIFSDFDIYLIF